MARSLLITARATLDLNSGEWVRRIHLIASHSGLLIVIGKALVIVQ